jgi:hypothetical protein
MSEQQYRFLTLLGRLPARLTMEQTAWVLNCQPHDVPVLVAVKLLKPLGNPPPNGTKYFATADILEWMADRSWLVKITNAVSQHWKEKNANKKGRFLHLTENGQTDLPAAVND